ncbi:hypothetical protein ACO2Q8_28920 [Larkinella sp. VNQ87]|uniref:hypothetical protein n=1 Tax=Larkinella sp. VNQ87 TaxID=3400921 RepID=UPI003C022A3A
MLEGNAITDVSNGTFPSPVFVVVAKEAEEALSVSARASTVRIDFMWMTVFKMNWWLVGSQPVALFERYKGIERSFASKTQYTSELGMPING